MMRRRVLKKRNLFPTSPKNLSDNDFNTTFQNSYPDNLNKNSPSYKNINFNSMALEKNNQNFSILLALKKLLEFYIINNNYMKTFLNNINVYDYEADLKVFRDFELRIKQDRQFSGILSSDFLALDQLTNNNKK
jgi:hypothetical protein